MDNLDLAYDFVQTCSQNETFRQDQLRILLEKNESNEKPDRYEKFECNICKKYFKLKRSLKLHFTRIHPNSDNEKLHKEDIKLENGAVDIHESADQKLEVCDQSEHLEPIDDPSYDYDDPGNISSNEENKQFQINLKKKHTQRKNPLTCEYCGKLFYRRQHYSAHLRAKHTFEKPYKCDLCDAKYTNSHSLLVHTRNHKNERPFVCSYCGKSFVCSGDLYHHSKIHLNKREYQCVTCGKSFNTTSILRTHKICMHTDPKEWKYVCTYCPKRFPMNSGLATHMKRHVGVKEFTCHICQKQFFGRSELTKHFRSHSTERQYKCNICKDKEYKNPYGLRKHLKIAHDIGEMKIHKPEKKFMCTMCPKIFSFNNKLQKHIRTHTGEKPFKCKVCEKKFIDSYYRKVHMKRKHNVDLDESS